MFNDFVCTKINERDGVLLELERERHGLKYIYRYLDRGPGPLFVSFPALRPEAVPGIRHFSRLAWAREIRCSFLLVTDPFWQVDPEIRTSAFQGGPDYFLAEEVAEDIAVVSAARGHSQERTLIYGWSAGGFPAILAGTFLRQASVIAEAPQLFLRAVEKLGARWGNDTTMAARVCYGVPSASDIPESFNDRLSAPAAFMVRGMPAWLKIFVRQSDTYHLEKHVRPLVAEFPSINLQIFDDTTGTGHSPLKLAEVKANIIRRLGLEE